mgnify:CR=1 FL=1
MIRIIDEEGYENKVVINSLNLRMKYYDFFVVMFDNTVKVVNSQCYRIRTKSTDMAVSGMDSYSSTIEKLVRCPDTKETIITLDYEKNIVLVKEWDESEKEIVDELWISPIDKYISFGNKHSGIYSMSKTFYDDLIKKDGGATVEGLSVDNLGTTIKLARMANPSLKRDFINDLEKSSN